MSFVTCITSQCVIWRTMNLNYEIEVSNYCYIGSETRSLPTDQPTMKAIWHLLLRNINNICDHIYIETSYFSKTADSRYDVTINKI